MKGSVSAGGVSSFIAAIQGLLPLRRAERRTFLLLVIPLAMFGIPRSGEGGGLTLAVIPRSGEGGGLVLAVTPRTVIQGQTVRVRVRTDVPPYAIRLRAGSAIVPLHRYAGGYQAFLGTSPLTHPGMLDVQVVVRRPGRQQTETEQLTATEQLHVRGGAFGIRRLRVSRELLDPELVARERRRIAAATAAPLPIPLWAGRFRFPVNGPVTSSYGVRSIYNGIPRGYHLGVDFRSPAGTPVHAAQHGLVTLAEALPLSGQTLVLDHGAGVFTTYQHLSAIAVRPGRRVAVGEVVGRVGSTGLSTGPHLHWGMRIHGVRVNPLDWTVAGPLTTP